MWKRRGMLVACVLSLAGCTSAVKPSGSQHTALAELDTKMAIVELQHHQPQEAHVHELAAMQLDSSDPFVWVGAGYYHLQMNERAQAEIEYHHALMLAPDAPQIQDEVGVFLYQTGQIQQALALFLKAAHQPDNLYAADAYRNAAQAEAALGESKQAHLDQIQAIRMSP